MSEYVVCKHCGKQFTREDIEEHEKKCTEQPSSRHSFNKLLNTIRM